MRAMAIRAKHFYQCICVLSWLLGGMCALAGEPPLPAGLGSPLEPKTSVPSGHDDTQSQVEKETVDVPATVLTGFFDTRVGTRTQNDSHQDQTSLAETRPPVRVTPERRPALRCRGG
jgi:hypothetical protein